MAGVVAGANPGAAITAGLKGLDMVTPTKEPGLRLDRVADGLANDVVVTRRRENRAKE
jgi:hypothetical protein